MEAFDVTDIYNALLVFIAVCVAIAAIGKAYSTIKDFRKPQQQASDILNSTLTQYKEFFAADKRRLDKHEAELEDLREGQKVLCVGIKALLEHELHNGNSTEMQEASSSIDTWLINRH